MEKCGVEWKLRIKVLFFFFFWSRPYTSNGNYLMTVVLCFGDSHLLSLMAWKKHDRVMNTVSIIRYSWQHFPLSLTTVTTVVEYFNESFSCRRHFFHKVHPLVDIDGCWRTNILQFCNLGFNWTDELHWPCLPHHLPRMLQCSPKKFMLLSLVQELRV